MSFNLCDYGSCIERCGFNVWVDDFGLFFNTCGAHSTAAIVNYIRINRKRAQDAKDIADKTPDMRGHRDQHG